MENKMCNSHQEEPKPVVQKMEKSKYTIQNENRKDNSEPVIQKIKPKLAIRKKEDEPKPHKKDIIIEEKREFGQPIKMNDIP